MDEMKNEIKNLLAQLIVYDTELKVCRETIAQLRVALALRDSQSNGIEAHINKFDVVQDAAV